MNNTEHATAKDFFKYLGVVIGALFTILFVFLKMLGDSSDSDENTDVFGVPEDDYDDLSSASLSALSNLNNLNHDD